MSTSDRHEVQRLAARAEEGIATLEAPVTGGVHRAAAGEITVLVGGDGASSRPTCPAFQAMGGKICTWAPRAAPR